MSLETIAQDLAQTVIGRAGDSPRFVIAIAGPPGAGKSALSEALESSLVALGHRAAIVPMDGFHFDNAVLEPRGQLPRKGAPFTFDADGYAVLLERLRAASGRDIAVPVFDRDKDLARAGGRIIQPSDRFLIAEGNYLLLDAEPWNQMAGLFDITVMVETAPEVLRQRLIGRWLSHGLTRDQAVARAMGNDIPNSELVAGSSRPADLTVRNDG